MYIDIKMLLWKCWQVKRLINSNRYTTLRYPFEILSLLTNFLKM